MQTTKSSLLIVDDEPLIRTALSAILNEMGWRVRTAQDGFSALEEIQREVPEVLLSDLNMPGMTGFELLTVVRRKFPTVMTVAMSGAFLGNEVPSGVAADAFYQKGSSLGSLLMIIEALPKTERRALPSSRSAPPSWMDCYGDGVTANQLQAITCPECHRTYPLALDSFGSIKREVNCVFCASSIPYTIADLSEQSIPQAFQRNAPATGLEQNAAITSK